MKRLLLLLLALLVLASSAYADADWHDASWSGRRAISLPQQDLNKYMVIKVDVDFTDLNVLDDMNDLIVVDANRRIEVWRVFDGDYLSEDGNLYFPLTNQFSAGDADFNTTYFIYYGNADPPNKDFNILAARANITAFETETFEGWTLGNDMVIDSNGKVEGLTSLNTFDDGSAASAKRFDITSLNDSNNDVNYSTLFKTNDSSVEAYAFQLYRRANDQVQCEINIKSGTFRYHNGAGETDSGVAVANDTIYKIETKYVDFAPICYHSVYEEDGTVILSVEGRVEPSASHEGNIPDEIVLTGTATTKNGYFDNVTFEPAINSPGLGEERLLAGSDVNLNILIPINEDTGEALDMAAYSFNVKILANGVLTTHLGLRDNNFFQIVPEVTSIITIDTNSNDFIARQYSLLFDIGTLSFTLQPYLPPSADSVQTTIHVLSAINLTSLPDYRVKVFKGLTGGRTLIHNSITDGKGETTIPFIVADEYEIEVFDDLNNLVKVENYTATSTTTDHYIYIGEDEPIEQPDIPNISVTYSPAIRIHNTRDINVTVNIVSTTSDINAIQVIVVNNDVNLADTGMDVFVPDDGNTYVYNMNDLPGLDTNFAVDFVVIVQLKSGEEMYFRENSYWLRPNENEMVTLLTINMRQDFGCDFRDLSKTCEPLMFIAFFIIGFVVIGAGVQGFRNGIGLTIFALIITSGFVYITWIPLWVFAMMVIAGVGAMVAMARMD